MTNNKYKELNNSNYDYFDQILQYKWITFYTLICLCQSDFYTLLYNRVLYVTGATGQGQFTQTPKLLLYTLKAIDYVNGNVLCTAPRIIPLSKNSNRISEELCVPIPFNKYFVQYKHNMEEHVSTDNYCIRIITDGILINKLIENVTLYKNKHENMFINVWAHNLICIDEANEHNSNMDWILTLMNKFLLINN